jgi:hypothetical protein
MQRNPFTFKWNTKLNKKVGCDQFVLDLFDQSRHCTSKPLGIFHACVDAAEHLVLHPLIPMVILAHPGPMPAGHARHPWAYLNAAYEEQETMKRHLLTYITSPDANMPEDILRSMQDGVHGLSTRDLRWIITFLRQFAVFAFSDIDQLMESFKLPWDSTTDINIFIHDKQHTMRLLAANHCPMNNRDAYVCIKSWFNLVHWAQCWNEHARTHATLATLDVDDLCRDIILYSDTSLPHMTTAQAGYHAAAAIAQPLPTSVEEAVAAAMAVYEAKNKPASKWKYYCHTHGPNNDPTHTSTTCRNPHPTKHNKNATINDRKGGAKHRSE